MLTAEQEKFLHYWEANREKESKLLRQARGGLPIGLSVGAGILICVFSGWYKRAMMELSTEVSPALLITAILIISVMYAVFSQKQKWEMNEQSYKELLAKIKREKQNEPVSPENESKKAPDPGDF